MARVKVAGTGFLIISVDRCLMLVIIDVAETCWWFKSAGVRGKYILHWFFYACFGFEDYI